MDNALTVPGQSVNRPGWADWLGLCGVFLGWFVLDLLVVRAGPLRSSLKFYELSAVIADPARVLFGVDVGHRAHSIVFSMLCLVVLSLPLLARRLRPALPRPVVRIAFAAPLALLLLVAAVLYWRTSGDVLTQPQDAAPVTQDLLRLANHLLNQGASAVSRTVAAGKGAWLSLASGLWLAARGLLA